MRERSSSGEWFSTFQRLKKVALFPQFHISAILEEHFLLFRLLPKTTNINLLQRIQPIPIKKTRYELSKMFLVLCSVHRQQSMPRGSILRFDFPHAFSLIEGHRCLKIRGGPSFDTFSYWSKYSMYSSPPLCDRNKSRRERGARHSSPDCLRQRCCFIDCIVKPRPALHIRVCFLSFLHFDPSRLVLFII